jgi:putative peptidoglycan lipid II flippase
LRGRLGEGFRQVVFFVVPSAFAFAALGSQLVGALFETGSFDSSDTMFVAGILAAYALAVPAQTSIKLLASGHYALGDTKTPVRIGVVAVIVSAVSAFGLMQVLGAAGIALGAAAGAYLNVVLNSFMLKRRLGSFVTRKDVQSFFTSALAAIVAAVLSSEVGRILAENHIWIEALCAVCAFAATYACVTLVLKHPEAQRMAASLRRSWTR